jgi:NADH-quinone oxidoreductase subunit L
MTGPLIILATLSLAGGFIPVPHFLEPAFPHVEEGEHGALGIIATAAGFIGIALAYLMYVAKPALSESMARTFSGLHTLLSNKYYVDEAYSASVIEPTVQGSTSVLWRGFDVRLIDGIVNGVGRTSRYIGDGLRRLQSGYIRSYAAWVVLGSIVIVAAMTFMGAGR